MPRQPIRPYLPIPRPAGPPHPPPVVIDAAAGDPYGHPYPPGSYPPPAYPAPAYPPSPPEPPRRGKFWRAAAALLLAPLAAGGLWLASQQPAARSPEPLDALPAYWWQGEWVTASGADVPRLELSPLGGGVTGRLVLGYTGGYVMSLPLLEGEAGDSAVLFAVEGQPPYHVAQLYLLEQQEPGATARLYHLRPPPPGRPYTATLRPRNPAQSHTLVATLVRPGTAGTLRLDRPPDPPGGGAGAARRPTNAKGDDRGQ